MWRAKTDLDCKHEGRTPGGSRTAAQPGLSCQIQGESRVRIFFYFRYIKIYLALNDTSAQSILYHVVALQVVNFVNVDRHGHCWHWLEDRCEGCRPWMFEILGSLQFEPRWRPDLINRPPYILNEGTNILERSSGSCKAAFSFTSTPSTETGKLEDTLWNCLNNGL